MRICVEGHEVRRLDAGWELAATEPDACLDARAIDGLAWRPARVPGTAAGAGGSGDLDAHDWWFRTRFAADPAGPGEELVLRLDGIATVAEVYLNGERVATGESMFTAYAVDVAERLSVENELAICCRSLAPLLRERRRPRARWRTNLVAHGNLRFFRTMLLGRAPGFAPGPAAVGPWRPARLERRRRLAVDELTLRPRVDGSDGVLVVHARLRSIDEPPPERAEVELRGPSGTHAASLALADGVATGELRVPDAARWWPHTHGDPVLHDVRLRVDGLAVEAGRVGFRQLSSPADPLEEGLDLHVNGVRVFARGAVWTPLDPVGLAPTAVQLRAALEQVRDAGMNMLRIPGTAAYESEAFHALCDELGILVWQDFMFANLDYPVADEGFRALVEREAREVMARLAGRPSLAVVCGNSEVEQQVAMLGLDAELGRGPLFGELLPAAVAASGADAVYLPSTPSGGTLPFRPDRGVAHYYGVGGYRRPLEDVRRADVRFAAECLAFANVPDEDALPHGLAVHDPRWKAGVPRDIGSGWDFDDVRDHYLSVRFGIDPTELRRFDHDRYLELSRAVTGEAMAEVFGEWRRAGSPCRGGLVLWLRDLSPGAGWGVVDHRGEPKFAYHQLRRALAPVAVWTTDEGLNGVAIHVANDGPAPLAAQLRVALYREFEQRVDEAHEAVEIAAHGTIGRDVEGLIGRFVDAAWAYRFGPPAQHAIVVSLERDGELLSQAVRFPAGPPLDREGAARLGLRAHARPLPGGGAELAITSRRLAYGVRVHAPGLQPSDDAFATEPGRERIVRLRPRESGAAFAGGTLTAVNLDGRVPITAEAGTR